MATKDNERTFARKQILLPSVRCSFFDKSCDFLRPGNIDRVTGAGDFDRLAVGSCGIPPFEIGIDSSVFCCDQHRTRFAFPRRCGDDCFEVVSCVEYLRSRHESGLLRRQIGGKVLVKLRWIEVSETVWRLLYRCRLAEITWEALSVIILVISSIRHVGRYVAQS